jgi:predicted transcriptional regulator YdeE
MNKLWCIGFAKSGESEMTSNADETRPETSRIGRLWERFLARRRGAPVGMTTAIYDCYESDHRGSYRVTIADELEESGPESANVPEGWYLRFVAVGPQPSALNETWKRICRLSEEGKIQRSYKADYELHVSPSRIEVYVAVN